MIKMLTRLGLFVLILGALFILPANAASGQDTTTATLTSLSTEASPATVAPTTNAPTAASSVQLSNSLLAQEVTLASLGVRNLELVSPVGSAQIPFRLPDNWQPNGSNYLSLNAQFFLTGIEAQSSTALR